MPIIINCLINFILLCIHIFFLKVKKKIYINRNHHKNNNNNKETDYYMNSFQFYYSLRSLVII